jgi:hypothetical protein
MNPVLKNNYDLAVYLESLPAGDRQKEYDRLWPIVEFKPKSFGYLMNRYEQWKRDHGIDS